MRQHEQELDRLGVRACVVTFEVDYMAQAYVRNTKLQWPLLIDAERKLYRAYGMERGSWREIYGLASWWAYAKLFARGRRPRLPGSDVHQLGGDVLIDRAGIVRFHHVGRGPADRPAVAELLHCVAAHEATSNS